VFQTNNNTLYNICNRTADTLIS